MTLTYRFNGREGDSDEAAAWLADHCSFGDYIHEFDYLDETDWVVDWVFNYTMMNHVDDHGETLRLWDVRKAFFKTRLENDCCTKGDGLLGVGCIEDDMEEEDE